LKSGAQNENNRNREDFFHKNRKFQTQRYKKFYSY
jgi:hypothetical protein